MAIHIGNYTVDDLTAREEAVSAMLSASAKRNVFRV